MGARVGVAEDHVKRELLLASGRRVDLETRQVWSPDGTSVPLTGIETALLSFLSEHGDRPADRDELLMEVWGWSPGVITRTIDNAVRRLRVKIEADPARPRALITAFGEGYRLVLHEAVVETTRSIAFAWRVSGFETLKVRSPELAGEVLSVLATILGDEVYGSRPILWYPDARDALVTAGRAIAGLVDADWSSALLHDPCCDPPPAAGRWRGPRLAVGIADASGDEAGTAADRAWALAIAAHGGSALAPATLARAAATDLVVSPVGGHDLGDGLRVPLVRIVPRALADRTFPPPRTRALLRTNLVPEVAAFVGRRRELAALRACVTRPGLVTLHGPAGAGKTRLIQALGLDRAPHFSGSGGGVWFVDLATCSDEGDVLAAVAAVIGVPLDPEGDVPADRAQVGRALNNLGSVLVILDNVEQVAEGARSAVETWLKQAPSARFFATSRVPMAVPGEVVVPLPPLDLDEAVALFFLRALAARPDSVDPVDDRAIALDIVRRLEGNALAVELAAARVGLLAPADLLHRLDDHLLQWRAASPDVASRQASLQAAIAWSWDLLDHHERSLLCGLALFPAGTAPRALDAILGEVGQYLSRLVDHALVRVDEFTDGERRVRLAIPVRVFALAQPDPQRALRQKAFAAYFVEHAAHLGRELAAGTSGAAVRLQREVENLRSAFRWATEEDPPCAARLALALVPALAPRGPHEGLLEILGLTLDLPGVPKPLRADVFRARGIQRVFRLDLDGADEDLRAACRNAENDAERVAQALVVRAGLAQRRGQSDLAEMLLGTALRLGVGGAVGGQVLAASARFKGAQGLVSAARAVGTEAREALSAASRALEAADLDVDLAAWCSMGGDLGQARSFLASALRVAREHGDLRLQVRVLAWSGHIEHDAGNLDDAHRILEEAHQLAIRLGDRRRAAACLGHLGAIYAEQQDGRAIGLLDAAVADLAGGADVKLEALFLAWRASAQLREGRLASALEDFRRALTWAEGDRRLETRLRIRAAWVVAASGRPAEATGVWEKALDEDLSTADPAAALAARIALGHPSGPPEPHWGVEARLAFNQRQALGLSTPGTRRI
jgi:predicted ATPase/DNA-binding winged helix-turn-helix (wHTH) protein